jgi:Tfp pilus assembly protein PilE
MSENVAYTDKDYKPQMESHLRMVKKHESPAQVRKVELIKAGDAIAKKLGIPADPSANIAEDANCITKTNWDKINPRIPPAHTKKVEMKVVKKKRGKPCRVSFD